MHYFVGTLPLYHILLKKNHWLIEYLLLYRFNYRTKTLYPSRRSVFERFELYIKRVKSLWSIATMHPRCEFINQHPAYTTESALYYSVNSIIYLKCPCIINVVDMYFHFGLIESIFIGKYAMRQYGMRCRWKWRIQIKN